MALKIRFYLRNEFKIVVLFVIHGRERGSGVAFWTFIGNVVGLDVDDGFALLASKLHAVHLDITVPRK